MTSTNTRILSVYKSRNTILEQLDKQGFNINDYQGFSINEVNSMIVNDQLDMLFTHREEPRKAYVKYYASKQIKSNALDDIIEDLYTIEPVLVKTDTLIIIIDDEPNDTILEKVRFIHDRFGYFAIIFNIKRLQYNVLNHALVPSAHILSDLEKSEFMTTYQIKDNSKLPEISRFDPQALSIGLRPGQICRFERSSSTAMKNMYYRACV